MTLSMTAEELRARLGRLGIWMPPPAWIGADPAATAAAIERAGFTSVWIGGGNATPDAFTLLRPLLTGSSALVVATGIVNIWAWEPAVLRAEAAALAAEFPGRLILGLGVSHEPLVASLGHAYQRPLEKMEKFLDELDHPAAHGGDSELPPVVLAALGPRMLTLSAERTLGAHPYFTPPEHTAFARKVLGASPLLVPEQALSLAAGQAEGLAAGRAYAARYLRMPNYTRNLERFGFGPADFADGGSDRLISAIIPAGASAVADRVRAHLDAGADHVVLQPLDEAGAFAVGQIGQLAATLAELMQKRSLCRSSRVPLGRTFRPAGQPPWYRRTRKPTVVSCDATSSPKSTRRSATWSASSSPVR
jgi:probable F420-dependent oxidoreductase